LFVGGGALCAGWRLGGIDENRSIGGSFAG
jgi:hypothetical protein